MTANVFFWYILPLIIAAGGLGWIAYDRRKGGTLHPCE